MTQNQSRERGRVQVRETKEREAKREKKRERPREREEEENGSMCKREKERKNKVNASLTYLPVIFSRHYHVFPAQQPGRKQGLVNGGKLDVFMNALGCGRACLLSRGSLPDLPSMLITDIVLLMAI